MGGGVAGWGGGTDERGGGLGNQVWSSTGLFVLKGLSAWVGGGGGAGYGPALLITSSIFPRVAWSLTHLPVLYVRRRGCGGGGGGGGVIQEPSGWQTAYPPPSTWSDPDIVCAP